MNNISFKIIKKNSRVHIKMLYELLKLRNFNISHEKLPDFDSHKKFVANNSYRTWNIIEKNKKTLGTFYITFENEIGINLIEPKHEEYVLIIRKILEQFEPLTQVKSLRSKYFLFNTHPNNEEYIKSLESLKLVHIQNTYAYKNFFD